MDWKSVNTIMTVGSFIFQVRLVDGEGIINPKAFYNYLSAWASNDALAYGASQANLRPEPRPWYHAAEDFELKIPKSAPLVYTQLPFYLHGLGDTQHITNLIAQVCYMALLIKLILK
jgi:patched 1 protein